MKNNKAFTWLDVLILIIIVGGFAWWAFPKYYWEVEKSKAMVAGSFLLNGVIAENDVYTDMHVYTLDWDALKPFLVLPSSSAATFSVSGDGTGRFLSFSNSDSSKVDGFKVSLLLGEDRKSGQVNALREGSPLYCYTLSRDFVSGGLDCRGENKRSDRFCQKLLAFEKELVGAAVSSEASQAVIVPQQADAVSLEKSVL